MAGIKVCMITHDCLEKKDPRADLIRFKNIGKILAQRSIEVFYIVSNQKPIYEKGTYNGSKVYKIPRLIKMNILQMFFFQLFSLPVFLQIKKEKFDIIFINSIFMVPLVWVLRLLFKHALVQFDLMGILSAEKFVKHKERFLYQLIKKFFLKIELFLFSNIDFITTINNQHKYLLTKHIKKPIYVVRDGVFEKILRNSFLWKKDIFKNSNTIIIFVGQINHYRLDLLFKVLPSLINIVPELQFQVIGEGPHLNHYKKLSKKLGLNGYVSFFGYVPYEEIYEYISCADIAYSDDWSINGFPTKLFDYMAIGKAIVAEETEAIKEILIDQVNALLYKNEDELKEKIIMLAKDKALREKIGREAQRIIGQHTWERRGKILEAIYLQFICG